MSPAPRVAVTRPAGRGAGLVRALDDLGLDVVEVPLIEPRLVEDLGPLAEALGRAVEGDLVVLTSATSVPALVAVGGVPVAVRVAAVGPATASALAAEGIAPSLVGDGSGGGALAALVGPPPPGGRAILLAAAGGRPELADGLAAAGWEVDPVVVYATVARVLAEDDVMALAACDVVCFASPSAVAAFVALRDRQGRPLGRVPAAVIGATTAAAARAAGFAVAVATDASDAGLALAAAALAGPLEP